MIITEETRKKIIPIASGKGGVGKSVLTSNLGIVLAANGKKTILIDLDMGGSNLHTYLGIKNTNPGIGNFLSDQKKSFDKLLVETEYPNLSFIPGDVLVSGTANLLQSEKNAIIKEITAIEADYILLDLGSGSSHNVVDFFLISNSGIIVTTTQAPAVLNAYGFLKNSLYRHVYRSLRSNKRAADSLEKALKDKTPGSTPTAQQIAAKIKRIDKRKGQAMLDECAAFRPHLVINMAEQPDEIDIAESLKELVKNTLSIDLGCLGVVFRDPAVNGAIEEITPLVVAAPDAPASIQIERIAQKIIQSERFPIMPLDLDMYEDSFALARLEAETDHVEYHEPAAAQANGVAGMSAEDFLAIVSAHRKRIAELEETIKRLTISNYSS
ncbi:MAG: MinD/ParA family protein [Spirochaetaceae bacterium]|nr:MAG: MinD/ParA family protein [Spirochaetaceae bacterium]